MGDTVGIIYNKFETEECNESVIILGNIPKIIVGNNKVIRR